MNELTILNIDGIECYEKDGTAYLKLETVARGLGFTDNSKGVEYVRWNTVRQYLMDIGFSQEVAKDDFIPENVFYRLAMKAKNDTAEKFQAKVADEIIPSIRKHGGYIAGQETMTDEELLSRALLVADSKIKERDRIIARQSAEIEEMKPRVSYLDVILQNKSLVNTTTIAKDYGMTA